MFEALSVDTEHKDLIHDVAFDYYGQRMATCSSDQQVKVWDLDLHGSWHCTSSWKAHSGSVWKVTWAHPEFGQVLATCSFDRTAAVWEEIPAGDGPGETARSHWIRRTNMVDSRTSVTDVKFAPRQLGLQLATSSSDGVVRIYEAPDVMNLSTWTVQYEIQAKMPISCLTWNCSFSSKHLPLLAVGSDEVAAPQGTIAGGQTSNVVIGAAKVVLYEYSENSRRWAKAESLNAVTEPVHDITFAPNFGRSYHLLAIASRDVKLVILRPLEDSTETATGLTKFSVEIAARFEDHYSVVWRVSWNITGTILASSGDDNCVRLWKANYAGVWRCVEVLRDDTGSAHTSADSELPPISTGQSGGHSYVPLSAAAAVSGSQTLVGGATKYYKLGSIKNQNQVPWH
ncbi:nucleoporin SEH1 isoform X1 [Cloeon dipterum]|uniref:nucleoporin SEH1 isoform X1 n=1 Tax=Cloeon dipterum TaxID=197152 RepID=UPI00321F9385